MLILSLLNGDNESWLIIKRRKFITAFGNFKIAVVDGSTRDIYSIYLVAGFDEDKKHYVGRPGFRGRERQEYPDMCLRAERGQIRLQRLVKGNRFEKGDKGAWLNIQLLIVGMLKSGACQFRGMEYSFEVNFIDPQILDFLTWEVIAQVNEWWIYVQIVRRCPGFFL